MRFVRRVRWLRVALLGLAALVAFLSLRLWQWTAYAERQAVSAQRESERATEADREIDRLNRELKDARLLVLGRNDEIVEFGWSDRAELPPNDRLQRILAQEYVPEELQTLTVTPSDVPLLWRRLGEYRDGPR